MVKYLSWRWLLLFALLVFSFAGTRPLGEPDEGRYAEAARELYRSGNWLIPQLQGTPHLTKPAFAYWMAAAGYRLLGVNEWGARIFLSLFFFMTILLAIELAKTWGWSRKEALAGGLIFSTAVLPYFAGHLLTTDTFLCFWETLAVLSFWKVWKDNSRASLWRWGFWLALGFAFLTKGPPGWMPLVPMIAFLTISNTKKTRPRLLRTVQAIPAILAFVLVSLFWYLALIIQDHEKLRYFLVEEVLNRSFSNKFGRDNPWWMYFFAIAGGLTPWVFLWPEFLRRLWRAIRPDATPGGKKARLRLVWQKLRRLEEARLFSLLWVVLMLAIFMLSKSRLPLYVLPLFVPISLWSGKVLIRKFPLFMPASPFGRSAALAGCVLWIAAIFALQLFAEKLPIDCFLRDLSRQLVQANPGKVDHIYTYYMPNHSLSFYTGMKLVKLEKRYKKKNPERKFDKMLPLMRADQAQGRLTLLALKRSHVKKLGDKGFKVLAKNKMMAIVMATDPPTSSTLQVATGKLRSAAPSRVPAAERSQGVQ